MESPSANVDDWVFNAAIFIWPMFFRTALLRSGGLSPEEGWDAVTDEAVGVNFKNCAVTENQGEGARSIWAKGCVIVDWVRVI